VGFAPTVIQILAFQAIEIRNRKNIAAAPRHAVANTRIIRNPTSIPVFVAPQNLVAI
jgi:hypothetical protein